MSFWQIVFHNFTTFDAAIVIAGAINLFIFFSTKYKADKLYDALHPEDYLPSKKKKRVSLDINHIDERDAVNLRIQAESNYALYTNITAIFPLLGILGTVKSLLPLVSDLSEMQGDFSAALTSTFWGLVFSIFFKFLDGKCLSFKMDENDRSVTLLLENQLNESNESEEVFV